MMRHTRMLLVAGTLFGTSLGWVVTASAADQDKCFKNQCSLDDGDCFPTDINFNCGETLDEQGCKAVECKK